jgi:DNA-binding transcriptional LysR family regulator
VRFHQPKQLQRIAQRRGAADQVGDAVVGLDARAALELLAAKEFVTTLGRSLQGRVRLSVPSGCGQVVMSGWLIEFKRLYPGIVLDVMFENRVEDLLREEVDIAIRVMSEPPQALVARELGPVRYVACASREFAAQRALPAQLQGAGRGIQA